MTGTLIREDAQTYTLDSSNRPIPAPQEFFEDMMHSERRFVGRDTITTPLAKVVVSTIFLGIKQDNGTFFETRILGGEFNDSHWQYNTYDQALNGHEQIVSAFHDNQ